MRRTFSPEERRERNREACRKWYKKLDGHDKDERLDRVATQNRARNAAKKAKRDAEKAANPPPASEPKPARTPIQPKTDTKPAPPAKPMSLEARLAGAIVERDGLLYAASEPERRVCSHATRRGRLHGGLRISIDGETRYFDRGPLVYLLHFGVMPAFVDHIDGDFTNDRISNLAAVSEDPLDPATFPFPGVRREGDTFVATAYLPGSRTLYRLGIFSIAVDAAIAVARHHLHYFSESSVYCTSPDLIPFAEAAS